MTRVAYFDLANGISGDIILSCLAHAGRRLGIPVDKEIADTVASLDIGATVTFTDDERSGIACLCAEVTTSDERYTAEELRRIISRSQSSERALRGLDLLVGAEADVHGVDPENVHLHELASGDTAVDLAGTAAGIAALGIERVAAAAVPVPSGWTDAEHGSLPLPAPATLEILRGARLRGVDATKELVTPTGAAVLVAHDTTFGPLAEMVLEAIGVGAGQRREARGERPNICRVLVGTAADAPAIATETCVVLECNIDDQTPEQLGYAIETLLRQGALDVWVTPIVMKRSRPAFELSVLVRPSDEALITEEVFRATTTLGLRRRELVRSVLDREEVRVDLDGHDVRVKVARLGGEVVNVAPEFADCAVVADVSGLRLSDVYARAEALARRAIEGA
jgi:pyridinium-3,5-bisthiocarboxylic acid mononucleotide nickel chelatase